MNKIKHWWQNGNRIWILYLLTAALITLIAKASVFVSDAQRYETRIQKLEKYREDDIRCTAEWRAEIKKDVEHIKDGIDEIKNKL